MEPGWQGAEQSPTTTSYTSSGAWLQYWRANHGIPFYWSCW